MKIDDAKIRNSSNFTPIKPMLARRTSAFNDFNRSEIVYLTLEQLTPYRNQARKVFDETELNSMAATIKEHGIRQPLTVFCADPDRSVYEVVSGERRLRAAKIAGLTKVPCIILQNGEKAEEIALIENIQRQDLHPIELSRALKKMCETRGWGGQTELKEKLGISLSTISELLKLGEFSEVVQNTLLEKNIRGRDYFRKLFALKNDELRFLEIEGFAKEPGEKISKTSPSGNRSLLRMAIGPEGLKIQKGKLSSLTKEEKIEVKNALLEVIRSM